MHDRVSSNTPRPTLHPATEGRSIVYFHDGTMAGYNVIGISYERLLLVGDRAPVGAEVDYIVWYPQRATCQLRAHVHGIRRTSDGSTSSRRRRLRFPQRYLAILYPLTISDTGVVDHSLHDQYRARFGGPGSSHRMRSRKAFRRFGSSRLISMSGSPKRTVYGFPS